MIDVFDIFAFVGFAVLLGAILVIVVGLGSLPGWIARKRGHLQAAAINVASWLGVATLGLLGPLALIWAFLVPRPLWPTGPAAKQKPARVLRSEWPAHAGPAACRASPGWVAGCRGATLP
jgi:hypothetical protein